MRFKCPQERHVQIKQMAHKEGSSNNHCERERDMVGGGAWGKRKYTQKTPRDIKHLAINLSTQGCNVVLANGPEINLS